MVFCIEIYALFSLVLIWESRGQTSFPEHIDAFLIIKCVAVTDHFIAYLSDV